MPSSFLKTTVPATSWPWSTSCHVSGPFRGSWWGSSCPEHLRWWAWTCDRPPHRSAGQRGSPRTHVPSDHRRQFLDDHKGNKLKKESTWTCRTGSNGDQWNGWKCGNEKISRSYLATKPIGSMVLYSHVQCSFTSHFIDTFLMTAPRTEPRTHY